MNTHYTGKVMLFGLIHICQNTQLTLSVILNPTGDKVYDDMLLRDAPEWLRKYCTPVWTTPADDLRNITLQIATIQKWCMIISIFMLLVFSMDVFADESDHQDFFDVVGLSESQRLCYNLSMIGFDSVINVRSGLLPEHAFNLIENHIDGEPVNEVDIPMLRVVLDAYRWNKSPHTYAIKTFAECLSSE